MRILLALLGPVLLAGFVVIDRGVDSGVEAGTAVRLDVAELTAHADLILEGRVLSAVGVDSAGVIETEYLIQVERTFRGADYPYRTVRLPGGVLEDGRGMILSGMPRLSEGEDVLLFLSEESRGGMRMPVGLAQGKYSVVRGPDGTKLVVRDSAGVALVNRSSGELVQSAARTRREYAEVVARILAALAVPDAEGDRPEGDGRSRSREDG